MVQARPTIAVRNASTQAFPACLRQGLETAAPVFPLFVSFQLSPANAGLLTQLGLPLSLLAANGSGHLSAGAFPFAWGTQISAEFEDPPQYLQCSCYLLPPFREGNAHTTLFLSLTYVGIQSGQAGRGMLLALIPTHTHTHTRPLRAHTHTNASTHAHTTNTHPPLISTFRFSTYPPTTIVSTFTV